jgi:hypothetical protein
MCSRTRSLAVCHDFENIIPYADLANTDFLYGHKDGKDLDHVFDDLKWYDTLLGWRSEQWSEFITR